MNLRPLGYEGKISPKAIQRQPTKPNKTKEKVNFPIGPGWVLLDALHGQNTDIFLILIPNTNTGDSDDPGMQTRASKFEQRVVWPAARASIKPRPVRVGREALRLQRSIGRTRLGGRIGP